MRGDTVPPNKVDPSDVIIQEKRKNRLIAANIIDPTSGDIQFHIVSTKWFSIAVVSMVTLILCGLVVLALVIYVKVTVDRNTQDIENIKQDVPIHNQ